LKTAFREKSAIRPLSCAIEERPRAASGELAIRACVVIGVWTIYRRTGRSRRSSPLLLRRQKGKEGWDRVAAVALNCDWLYFPSVCCDLCRRGFPDSQGVFKRWVGLAAQQSPTICGLPGFPFKRPALSLERENSFFCEGSSWIVPREVWVTYALRVRSRQDIPWRNGSGRRISPPLRTTWVADLECGGSTPLCFAPARRG